MRNYVMSANGLDTAEVGTNVRKRWLDSFTGSALRSTKWKTLQNTGMTFAVANSDLTVQMGTTPNAILQLLSEEVFTIPFDIFVTLMMSQRIANNEVLIEAVEVGSDGSVVVNPNNGDEQNNRLTLKLNGTVATSAIMSMLGDGAPAETTQTVAGQATTASRVDFTLQARFEEAYLSSVGTNSATAKGATIGRLSQQSVDPSVPYKVRMTFKNLAVAPASNTTVTVSKIAVKDQEETLVEIIGTGEVGQSRGVPVNIANTPTVSVSGTPNVAVTNTPTVTANQSAASVYPPIGTTQASGTTLYRLLSAATTNLTSVKASAGRLFGGYVKNRSAAEKFVKLYNKASAPVLASDVPVMTISLAAGERVDLASVLGDIGHSFSLGIAMAIVGGVADTDATAVALNDVFVNLLHT